METHGTAHPDFEAVRAAFEKNFADGLELGAAAAVTVEGETVVDFDARASVAYVMNKMEAQFTGDPRGPGIVEAVFASLARK